MNHQLYKLLLRSISEDLGQEETNRLRKALEEFPELREEQERLLAQKKLLASQEFRYKPFFATRVLAKIDKQYRRERTLLPGLTFAFNRVALPVLGVLVALLATTYFSEHSLSLDALTGASELSVEEVVSNIFVSL